MEIEGRCSNCGQKLALRANTQADTYKKMLKRYLDKHEVEVLCGNCGQFVEFGKEEEGEPDEE